MHLSVGQLVRTVLPYLLVGVLMGLGVWGLRVTLAGWGWPALANLIVCVGLGALFYGGIMLGLNTEAVQDLKRFVGWNKLMRTVSGRKAAGASAGKDVGA